ncbi:MAG: beta strand repeat-containing protein [bacterium]
MPTPQIISEVNAVNLGLYDSPLYPNTESFWETFNGNSSTALSSTALDFMGYTATYTAAPPSGGPYSLNLTYSGVPITGGNIANEIVNIYSNLFGAAVSASDPGVQYWANQWDNGTSIGQITAAIYNIVENLPSTSPNYSDTITMNANIFSSEVATYSEVNALYLGLFDRPADPNGQAYWASTPPYLPSLTPSTVISTASVISIGSYAVYDGAAINNSNIANEIVNIYYDLLGAPVTTADPGVQYWANQYITGSQTIGQIVNSIYNIVENLPSTSPNYSDTITMNEKLTAAEQFTQSYIVSGVPSSYADAAVLLNSIIQPNVINNVNIILTPGSINTYADANYTFNIANDTVGTTLTAGNGNDTVNITGISSGNETITLGTGGDTIISSGTGNDTIMIGTAAAEYSNTNTVSITDNAASGNNIITVNGSGNNSVDLLQNNGNNSIAMAGNGNDDVFTGQGNNSITITGNGNNFALIGGSGNAGSGNNTVIMTGSGSNTIYVDNGNNAGNDIINLAGATGADNVSIGQGINTITFGSGADSLNLTTPYVTFYGPAAGATTLNGVITGDTLVFNHSADGPTNGTTVTPLLFNAAFGGVLGSESTVPLAAEITNLQGTNSVAGYTIVGWTTGGTANTYIVMAHNTGAGFVDQVVQIVGTPAYLSFDTAVSVNSATHLVSVAL